jgi:hypothetical protein
MEASMHSIRLIMMVIATTLLFSFNLSPDNNSSSLSPHGPRPLPQGHNSNTLGSSQSPHMAETLTEYYSATKNASEAIAQYRAAIDLERETLDEYRRVLKDEQSQKNFLPMLAFAVSIVALIATLYFSHKARQHNRLSVRPLPFVRQPDFENRIGVSIQNNGTGPMILKSAKATADKLGPDDLIHLVPHQPGIVFRNFNVIGQPRSIRPGDSIDLIDLQIDPNEPNEETYRDQLRMALGNMTLELRYTDIYETPFAPYVWRLDWFHRHWPELAAKASK